MGGAVSKGIYPINLFQLVRVHQLGFMMVSAAFFTKKQCLITAINGRRLILAVAALIV